MVSQIFKKEIPPEILYNLLEKICDVDKEVYVFNHVAFKRGNMEDKKILNFIDEAKEYYHNSKHHYLEEKMTYKKMTTIIRQICRVNNIPFTSEIKYQKSTYEIIYYIHKLED